MELKKDDIITAEITDMGSDGEGIGKIDGFPVFIKDAVKGDRVSAKITKAKKNMAYGRMIEILKPSELRTEPRCREARRCGGCQIQALAYEAQLSYKRDKVYNSLLRIAGIPAKELDLAEEAPEGMEEPWRYRNKAQYPIGTDKEGRIVAGFYASRTHDIIPCEDCVLAPAEYAKILRCIMNIMIQCHIEPYDEKTQQGVIRHVMIRKAMYSGQLMVCIISAKKKLPAQDEFVNSLIGIPGLKTIILNVNPENTNVIMGKENIVLYGDGYITDELGGMKFRISPLAFYQVNSGQALKVYNTATEYACLDGTEEVWDICCGIGTITLFLAQKARMVHGLEIVPEAIEDAMVNAALNGITNADFVAAAAEDYLPAKQDLHADAVVVDPPRSGLERVVLDAIVKASPSKIVYVSCDPATLSRDIKVFLAAGYKLTKFKVIDQFCHTVHVETVVLLSQQKPNDRISVDLDLDELDVTSAEMKATYTEIKDYVLKEHGLKVSNLYISQVKRKCGLEVGENYNLAKSEVSKQPNCPEEKEKAIVEALQHFGMVS